MTFDYPWNVRINASGVTFTGPGMESEQEARQIKAMLEEQDGIENVEVFQQ